MRRMLVILLALVLLLGVAQAETLPTLTVGAKGAQVRQLQQRLNDLGFLESVVDGAYGKQTAAAVRRAQQWLKEQGHTLDADGVAGPATLTLLYDDKVISPRLDLTTGARGARVTKLQNRLYDLNFLEGQADGRFGPQTEQALRALQKLMAQHQLPGVTETGIYDEPTRLALDGDLSALGIEAPEFFDDAAPEKLAAQYVNARSAIVMDVKTGEALFEKEPDQRMYPASTTKVMTLLLAVEMGGDLDRMVTVPRAAGDVPNDSSLVPVVPGEEMPLRALLYGLMIRSGNDAANAVADLLSGSVDAFVARMNEKAKELGMDGTHFVNPHGYHDDAHYTTARDMAVLCRYALANNAVREIATAVTYTMPATAMRPALPITTTAEILQPTTKHYYPGAWGIKSGFTNNAGFCYTGAAQKDGRTLVAVALKCRNRGQCWDDMKRLFNFGFIPQPEPAAVGNAPGIF